MYQRDLMRIRSHMEFRSEDSGVRYDALRWFETLSPLVVTSIDSWRTVIGWSSYVRWAIQYRIAGWLLLRVGRRERDLVRTQED